MIEKIDTEIYDKEINKILNFIINKERERSIKNGKFSHSDTRFVLMLLASYVSERILSKMMFRVYNAEQQILKKKFGLNDEYSKA